MIGKACGGFAFILQNRRTHTGTVEQSVGLVCTLGNWDGGSHPVRVAPAGFDSFSTAPCGQARPARPRPGSIPIRGADRGCPPHGLAGRALAGV